MSEKVVQVVLTSSNWISGSVSNNANYFIDWNAILKPNVPYKFHWSYIGGTNIYDGTKPAFVEFDFTKEVYLAGSTGGAQTSNIVGFLIPVVITPSTNTCFLTANLNTNEPVWMASRPHRNLFNVKIVDSTGALWTDNAGTPAVPAGWTIIIHFTEAEQS